MRKALTAMILLWCAAQTVGFGQSRMPAESAPGEIVAGKLGAQLDQYLTRLAAYGFSGTVLVAKEGEVVLHKGYGWADRERHLPNTTGTVYDVASLAKQFTATAVLKLEAQGKLKTSDPISKYLPDVPGDKRSMTLHHLLTHSSGLPFDCPEAGAMDRARFIKCMLAAKLHAEPGKQYEYSNAGFGLLAAVIELVSGQSYETFLREQLFKPAGLTATGFGGDQGKWDERALAHGYDDEVDRGTPQTRPITWQWRGAASLVTSVGDLYRWELALGRHQILPPASTDKLFAPHVATGQRGGHYGYGWAVAKTARGSTLIDHDGITFDGFNSIFQRYVDDGLVVIAASNHFFGRFLPMETVAPAIASIIFQGRAVMPPDFITLDAKAMEKYRGIYRLPSGARLMVAAEDEHLTIAGEGQEAIDLLAAVEPAESKALAAWSERTAEFINGARRGDYEPAVKAFASQFTPDQARQAVRNWLSGLEQKHGPLKSFESLGTVPERGVMRAFVRLNFERGSEVRRFRWEQGSLAGIVVGRLPLLQTTFRPQSATDFTGFHIGIAKPVRISFGLNAQGAVNGLTVHTTAGKTQAEKLPDAGATDGVKANSRR